MMERPPHVLMISPGYPGEMPFYARGLAQVGARVLGIGDTPTAGLPAMARDALHAYLPVRSLWQTADVIDAVRAWPMARHIDRVECLWEVGMDLAAALREALGLPGMSPAETVPFRDKEAMKLALDAAGIRTPRHERARSETEVRAAAARIGYPLIIKPIAGAGSADTYRVDGAGELDGVIARTRHVREVSVEEFIEGEEFTFDTVCAGGRILYHNVAWYRPCPLLARTQEWVSPQTISLRDVEAPHLATGVALGRAVIRALGYRTGFTHMEWFLTSKGEAVFGEIGARPPGARSTDLMNYSCDFDVWTAWAEAVCHGRISQPIRRLYNTAIVFKRAQGEGTIRRVDGLEAVRRAFGAHIVAVDLLPVGAHRRNWKATLLSDGWLIVRHPDLERTVAMADAIGETVQLYAS